MQIYTMQFQQKKWMEHVVMLLPTKVKYNIHYKLYFFLITLQIKNETFYLHKHLNVRVVADLFVMYCSFSLGGGKESYIYLVLWRNKWYDKCSPHVTSFRFSDKETEAQSTQLVYDHVVAEWFNWRWNLSLSDPPSCSPCTDPTNIFISFISIDINSS